MSSKLLENETSRDLSFERITYILHRGSWSTMWGGHTNLISMFVCVYTKLYTYVIPSGCGSGSALQPWELWHISFCRSTPSALKRLFCLIQTETYVLCYWPCMTRSGPTYRFVSQTSAMWKNAHVVSLRGFSSVAVIQFQGSLLLILFLEIARKSISSHISTCDLLTSPYNDVNGSIVTPSWELGGRLHKI